MVSRRVAQVPRTRATCGGVFEGGASVGLGGKLSAPSKLVIDLVVGVCSVRMSEPREHGEGEEEEEGEEEWESEDSWESDLDSEAEIAELMQMDLVDDSANTGKQEYLAKCSELQIVPVAMFIAKLECEHINLRHHGMGVKGARALAAALLANAKIRSLNLGDNWFGDEGVHAVAEVSRLHSAPPHGRDARPREATAFPAPATLCACHRTRLDHRMAYMAGPGLQLDDHVARPFGQPHWPARREGAVPPAAGTPPRLPACSPAAAPPARRRSAPPAPGRARARTRRSPSTCMWCAYGMRTCYVCARR